MAAQVIERMRAMLAEGNAPALLRAMEELPERDAKLAQTKAFQELRALLSEAIVRARLTTGMDPDTAKRRLAKAYKEIQAETIKAAEQTKKVPKPTNAGDLTTTATGGTAPADAAAAAPAATPTFPAEQPPGSAEGTGKTPGKGKGAGTQQRPSQGTSGASAGRAGLFDVSSVTPPPAPRTTSGPFARALADPSRPVPSSTGDAYTRARGQIQAQFIDEHTRARAEAAQADQAKKRDKKAAKTHTKQVASLQDEAARMLAEERAARAAGIVTPAAAAAAATGTPDLGAAAGRQVQQRLLGMGPLDPAMATANPTQGRLLLPGQVPVTNLANESILQNARTAATPAAAPAATHPLLRGLAPAGASLAAATQPLMDAQAQQMAALNRIAAEADQIAPPVRPRPQSLIPGIGGRMVDPRTLNAEGLLRPLRGPEGRLAATGKLGGIAARGTGGLFASSLANEFVVNPLQNAGMISPTAGAGLKGATVGAAAGAALGAPLFGIGAVPGAVLGGAAGGLLGILSGGGGGSKGDFDEASIMALPGLSDAQKNSLRMEYQFMLASGYPRKQVEATLKQKALQVFQQSQAERQQHETVLPNIMALQGMVAGYSKPYYDDFKAANNVQYDMARQMASALPENQRASALAYADQRKAGDDATAAAFGQNALLAPAFYLQDALRQNAYSSGQPPMAGLGLSGTLGVQGGGSAPALPPELLKQLGG